MVQTKQVRNRIGIDLVFQDGEIALDTNLANGAVKYTYFDLGQISLSMASLIFQLSNTTLTLEATNVYTPEGEFIDNVAATSTDGTGATFTATTLNSTHGYSTNDDLNGALIQVIADTTTPSNIGQKRFITDYVGSTGAATLSSALPGAITSGVTTIKIIDSPTNYGRRAIEAPTTKWVDVTNALLGAATFTSNGANAFMGKPYLRMRVKRLTTNATNSSSIQLSRARQ